MSNQTNVRRGELRADFSYNDVDRDGNISFAEFVRLLEQLDAGVSSDEARIGFDEIDKDHNGKIDFEEFSAWWEER